MVNNCSSTETTMRSPLALNPIDLKKKKTKPCVLTRAHRILPSLGSHVFIKYSLSHSDVKRSISIPSLECRLYLSGNEKIVTLVNERGCEFKVHYLRRSNRLGSGWIQFSALNNLYEGDLLVFQSIGYFKFKVYIFRKSDSAESDNMNTNTHEAGPANDLAGEDGVYANSQEASSAKNLTGADNVNAHTHETGSASDLAGEDEVHASTQGTSSANDLTGADNVDAHTHETGSANGSAGVDSTNAGSQETGSAKKLWKTNPKHIPEENIDQCEDIFCCTKEDVTSSRSSRDFKEMKKIEDFNIVINGLCIDSVISEHVRTEYYKLCRSQKSYLHDNILKDIYDSKWAANIISRIVNIANAIRACKLSTPQSVYTSWNKILYSFEVLGMNVEFLRARLGRLGTLSVDSKEDEMLRTQIVEARQELRDTEEKITTLEMEVSKLKEKKEELAAEIEAKKAILDNREHKFHEEVIAPW